MSPFRVGIIGCGRRGRAEGATGAGIAHHHVRGYQLSPDCEEDSPLRSMLEEGVVATGDE